MPQNAPRPLHFAAFVMNTTGHIIQGTWRRPDARQTDFNSLDHWVDLAKTLERGKFDAIFFADVVGLYAPYRGDERKYFEAGLQVPSNDPSVLASAIAYATEHLGIAFTASILQEHPFNFARRISTLDHASKGRIAWNIVTNYLPNASRNFGLEGLTAHDERYAWADEYVDVTYKLWEGSWEEDALRPGPGDRHPRRLRQGPPDQPRGPALPRRGPAPGHPVAAAHAAALPGRRLRGGPHVRGQERRGRLHPVAQPRLRGPRHDRHPLARRPARTTGRGPQVLPGPVRRPGIHRGGGEAHRRGARRVDRLRRAALAHVRRGRHRLRPRGPRQADRRAEDRGRPVDRRLDQGPRDRPAGRRCATSPTTPRTNSRIVGTPEQIADGLARWQAAGVDGINLVNAEIPGSYEDFVDQVIPVLQARGLAQSEYAEGTLRQKLFGQGDRLPERHPAARYRGAFSPVPAGSAL